METVVMYWEPQIKTYGFQIVKDLALYKYRMPADMPDEWTRAIKCIEDEPNRFHLVYTQLSESSELDVRMLCEPEQAPRIVLCFCRGNDLDYITALRDCTLHD